MGRTGKDGAEGPSMNNEHIIVLPNNTEPNAALPIPLSVAHRSVKSVSAGSSVPAARRSVFSDNKELFPRHSSYSAASSTSYGPMKESFNAIREETTIDNVEFSTPQLNHIDLNFDWNTIESLDLQNSVGHHLNDYGLSFRKDASNMINKNTATPSDYEPSPHTQENYRSPNFKFDSKRRKVDDISPNGTPATSANSKDMNLELDGLSHFKIDMDIHKHNDKGRHHSTPGSVGTPASMKGPLSTQSQGHASQGQFGQIHSNSPMHAMPREHESISDNGDWLQEIINTPYEPVFSNDTAASPKMFDEITSLFKTRQSDLSKHMHSDHHDLQASQHQIPMGNNNQIPNNEDHEKIVNFGIDISQDQTMNLNKDIFQDLDYFKDANINSYFICDEVRERIMVMSNLSDMQFPKVDELNNYMKLYEKEFNKYFPFIHLPSLRNPMVDKFENIPLLLAMTSIGALYSYNDANTLLLFNLSKYHIQNFFEKEVTLDNLQFKKVPLMAHQCLVLHIFISMFLNEPPMIDITSRQMKSMVGLIKSTNFHKPLDKFLVPPKSIIHLKTNDQNMNIGDVEYDHDTGLVQTNFDYFIMAQSRIRTIFVFYMLQQVRTSTLLDLSILLNGSTISSGNYCCNENLWKCENSSQWLGELMKMNNKQNIIDLSNNGTLNDLIVNLNKFKTMKLSFFNLLCLMVYVHERIQEQFGKLKQQHQNHHHNQVSNFLKFDYINWKLNNQGLKDLLKSWEMNFIKNDGVLIINDMNRHLLSEHNELKLILPMYHLAKIKICVNLTPIIERVVYKDWENMNNYLDHLHLDFDGLKESISYSIDTMDLWNQNILEVNNSIENNLRTPVFFVTCMFVSILLISQFLYYIEQINDKDYGIQLGVTEKILWLKCERILKKCEKTISLNYTQQNLFAEEYENYESIRKLIETNSNSKLIVNSLKLIKLSNKCLFLGVRILADAPIWPLAMGFAEALKNRANYISRTNQI
ncbi:hypothetical protein PSN45_000620 [Yamadazyma tenuis]|uniref:uncharacterized protein n=1 Tax=Candida tenuis TaxID=2315449 RepID=UPI0027A9961A|nr:hypothetical protein PSN45_000620 [Yamadazyma tenuis]